MTRVTLVESRGGRCRLRASGEFDRDSCEQFAAATRVALAGHCRELVVDLSGVTFLDAATVGVLLRCREAAAAHACDLRLEGEWGVAARVLDLARPGLRRAPAAGRR